jgi:hypothetical protein
MAVESTNIVSEKFWLNLAAEQIYSTFEKRAASVKSLQTIILWTYGLFTASGFVSSIFKDVSAFPDSSLFLFGGAFFLLTIAYALSNEAQNPVTSKFHPNDTVGIANSFSTAVKKQADYFKWASGITLLGFFLFALALLFLFKDKADAKKKVKDEIKTSATVKIGIEQKETLNKIIPVTISTGKGKLIQITIQDESKSNELILDSVFYADAKGNFYASFPVATTKDIKNLLVKATIKQSDSSDISFYESTIVKLKVN